MQVDDIASDFDIISTKFHITRKPLKRFGPEFRIGGSPVTICPLRPVNMNFGVIWRGDNLAFTNKVRTVVLEFYRPRRKNS